jgi:hypothetical protein
MTEPSYTDYTGHVLETTPEQSDHQSTVLVRETKALIAESTSTNNTMIGRRVNKVIKAFDNDPKLAVHHLLMIWGMAMNEIDELKGEA